MSNDDGQIFIIMKIRIFLIVLEFIQVCFGLDTNLTKDDVHTPCPISHFRGKRALPEYTRWRSNQMTKQEFIVKVDDDIVSPPIPNAIPVMAINIEGATKASEKIIIGGAALPSAATHIGPTVVPLDYTRFVPPTTIKVTQVDDDLYLAPAMPVPLHSIKGHSRYRPSFPNYMAKNPLRDDSPPASPHFITRTTLIGRQHPPISPVAFFTRSTETSMLITPPLGESMIRNPSYSPFRTTLSFDKESLSRTKATAESIKIFEPSTEESKLLDMMFTSIEKDEQSNDKEKSTTKNDLFAAADITTKITDKNEWDEVEEVQPKRKPPIDNQDSADRMSFYNEEENEISYKNKGPDSVEMDANRKVSAEEIKDFLGSSAIDDFLKIDTEDAKENELNVSKGAKYDLESKIDFEGLLTRHEILEVENENDDTLAIKNSSIEKAITSSEEAILQNVLRDQRRSACNLLKLRPLSFQCPRTLAEVVMQMRMWAEKSPIANWIDITKNNYTTMENPIYMMTVDDPSSGQTVSAKHTVLIVAGIQGRDHFAVTAALYLLYQLIERSEAHAELLSKYRFWVIPVLNPDGYDYSMTFPQRREWMKNLRQSWEECKGRKACESCEKYGLRCTVRSCYGVNLDRNFEYQWIPAEELHSEHPCGDLYAGLRQLSEHETRAFTHYLHNQRVPHTFIAYKEGEVLGVMYPYSHTRKKRAFDHVYVVPLSSGRILMIGSWRNRGNRYSRQRAAKAAQAAYSISGRTYVAGQTSEFLPMYAGGIEDWIDGHLGIDNTYTVMMFRPRDVDSKLLTESVVHEVFAATDTLLLYTADRQQQFKLAKADTSTAPPDPALSAWLLTLLALLLNTKSLLSS